MIEAVFLILGVKFGVGEILGGQRHLDPGKDGKVESTCENDQGRGSESKFEEG